MEGDREIFWSLPQICFNQDFWEWGPQILVLMGSPVDPLALESKGLRNWAAPREISQHCFHDLPLDHRGKLHV